MNWSDLLVIGIIAVFALIGFKNGFIFSVYRLASFLVSIILSIKLYPVLSKILMGTSLFTKIQKSIFKSLMLQQQASSPGVNNQVKEAGATAIVNNLHLPSFMKDMVKSSMPNPTSFIDISSIVEYVSKRLAEYAISIISLILIYIIIRVALIFARFLLKEVAKLPVFMQIDKVGGIALGAVEGLMTVYIAFAFIMLFSAAPQFKGLFTALDTSVIANYFYQNNFIIKWIFPG